MCIKDSSQPRTAVPESDNSACAFFPAPRSVDGILHFSMDSVCLLRLLLTFEFRKHCSTDTVFTIAVQGGIAAQTAFSLGSVANSHKLKHNQGAKLGEQLDSFSPITPESTENARKHTTRRPRRIARYAAISAVQSSPLLTTAAPTSAVLTTAARTTAAPVSAVLTATSVCGSVVAWPFGSAGNAPAFVCRSSPHQGPSNLAPAPLRHALQQGSPGVGQLLQQKLR